MMEKVLFTVLHMEDLEVKKLQDERLKAYNQGLSSYIWAADEAKMVAKPLNNK